MDLTELGNVLFDVACVMLDSRVSEDTVKGVVSAAINEYLIRWQGEDGKNDEAFSAVWEPLWQRIIANPFYYPENDHEGSDS